MRAHQLIREALDERNTPSINPSSELAYLLGTLEQKIAAALIGV